MFKKVALSLSLFLFVAGCGMFYSVDARRTAARVQRQHDYAAAVATAKLNLEKQRADQLARRTASTEQPPFHLPSPTADQMPAEDMNEILRQAPIEFEHLKKNSRLEQIAQSMQQKSKKALSNQVALEEKTTRWRDLLTATGFEISARRKPSNVGSSSGEAQIVPFDEKNVMMISFNKLATNCPVLKNPSFGVTLKLNAAGTVVAIAPLSSEMKIPTEEIQRCKFRLPVSKQKITLYKTMVLPVHKAGHQANL